MKMAGRFPGQLLLIFLFHYFVCPSSAQPDVRPDDENTKNTACKAEDTNTEKGCTHFPPHYGVVICQYCINDYGACATRNANFICWRCDAVAPNRPDITPLYYQLCDEFRRKRMTSTTTTTTAAPEEEDPDCQLWPLYLGWFVIIACLIYDTFLLLFFVPGFPGYARMQCWMGRARRPKRPSKNKRSAKRLEERKDPGVVEIEVEVDNKTSSEVQPTRKSSKSLGKKKSKKVSGQKKSRKSQSVV